MCNANKLLPFVFLLAALVLTACHHRDDNQKPKAVFSVTQPSADLLTSFSFSAAGSVDVDGQIVAYTWDFGDGTGSSEAAPKHTYRTSGKYLVRLTVTDDDGASASITQLVDITSPALSVPSSNEAFNLSLPNVATIEIPADSFTTVTNVGVWLTRSATTAADFDLTTQIFRNPLRADHEIRINTDRVQPLKTMTVTAYVPRDLADRLQAKDEPHVFVQIFQDSGEEVLDSFELIDSSFDATSGTLRFNLDAEMFTNRRSINETWEAIIVVGSTRTKPMSVPSLPSVPADPQGGFAIEQPRPWPRLAAMGEIASPGFNMELSLSGSESTCEGATLQAPLATTMITGAFNPPKHYGVDYRAANGTDVLSMAKGTVWLIGFDERTLKKPDPRSGKLIKGWGQYIIIEHEDGSKSLYAHLQKGSIKVSAQQSVAAGATIALSNDSGGSQAPHLHVEYAPNGEIFKRPSKANADACIGKNISGNVQVRDNGSIADDAFLVVINGRMICETNIGAANSCSIGALRSGSAVLSVTATIAPDDVGTYEVTLSGGLTFQDGSVTVSGSVPQGATASFIILIP